MPCQYLSFELLWPCKYGVFIWLEMKLQKQILCDPEEILLMKDYPKWIKEPYFLCAPFWMPCHHTCPLYPVCLLCPQWSCSCSSLSSLGLGCILSPISVHLHSFSQTYQIHSAFCAFGHHPTYTFVSLVPCHEIFCLILFALYHYHFVTCEYFANETTTTTVGNQLLKIYPVRMDLVGLEEIE